MQAMDGPINFGEKDRFWGLKTHGEVSTPFQQNYHPDYYQKLFEGYGFQNYFEQYFYLYQMAAGLPEKYRRFGDMHLTRKAYRCEHLKMNQSEKYVRDFVKIYNQAWVTHDNFQGMEVAQAQKVFDSIRPIVDEEVFFFVYHEDEPVAFLMLLPEINMILRRINTGKMRLWDKIRFAWHRWRGTCRRLMIFGMGVIPAHQKKGLEALMLRSAELTILDRKKYDDVIVAWIGDFNPKMVNLIESIGLEKVQTGITYRKLFDETKQFERAAVIL